MKSVWLLTLESLMPLGRRILTAFLFNLVGCLLLYAAFGVGLASILPHSMTFDFAGTIIPGLIVLVSSMVAFSLSISESWRSIRYSGYLDQLRTARYFEWQIHLAQSLKILIETIFHIVLTSLFLLMLSGLKINLFLLFGFWIYLIIGVIFIIQSGILIGIHIVERQFPFYFIILFLIPLFLMSGVLVPVHQYPTFWARIIYFLPTTAIVEGARQLFSNHHFNVLYFLYMLVLAGSSYLICFHFYRRKLVQ